MDPQSYKLGPGALTLGTEPLDVSAQITNCVVTPSENVSTTEAIPVLSGGQIGAEDDVTITYVIGGNLVQDLATGGVIDWTWINATLLRDFLFTPNNAFEKAVWGKCYIVPIAVGGDVKSRPRSDFSWRILGTPTFGDRDPVAEGVEPLV